MLLDNAENKINNYNNYCLHYNLTADSIYGYREKIDPFSHIYEKYIIAALISFDMGRMMGRGLRQKYETNSNGFARRLHDKLLLIEPLLSQMVKINLLEVDLNNKNTRDNIISSYNLLAVASKISLSATKKEFHVGSTKILHFLNPDLFMIVDANVATVLRTECGIPFRNSTQPGYSADLYLRSLSYIKDLIQNYGAKKFRSLESGTPLMRIMDKIAFSHAGTF
jgi:hypothetical protein